MVNILANNAQTIATAAPVNSVSVNIQRANGYAVVANVTVNTPSAKTFTANSSTMVFTATAHGMLTGLAVQVSNSGGALPTGLSGSTTYYVIYLTANTFQLATSLANAQAGTYLSISSNGTGTQTVTPTALTACSVSLMGSIDNVTFATIASSSQSVTSSGALMWNVTNPFYEYVLLAYTLTAGQISSTQNILVKGI